MGRHLPPLTRASRIGVLVVAMTLPARLSDLPTIESMTTPPLARAVTDAAPAVVAPREGLASWYSRADRGIRRTTASMERFDDQRMTCAMWDIPFNTRLRVTNLANGLSVDVRVNDRGPARRLQRAGRIVDLTRSAFARIAPLDQGLVRVRIEPLPHDR